MIEKRDIDKIIDENRKINLAIEDSTDAIGIADENEIVIYVNRAFEILTGYSKEELNAMGGPEVLYKEEVSLDIFTNLKSGNNWRGEVDLRRKDGKIVKVYLRANSYVGEDNKVKGLIGIHSNLEELIELKAQLDKKIKEKSNYFNLSYDLLCIFDKKGYFKEVNSSWYRILGWNEDEIIGKHYKDLVHEEDYYYSKLIDKAMYENDFLGKFENRIRTKDGKYKWFSWNLSIDRLNKITYGAGRDITEERKAKENEHKLFEEIEQVNKELKDFAYIVSHDLKAPLRGIATIANWVKQDYKDILDEQGKSMLDLLISRADRMKNLIDGILDYSRVSRLKDNMKTIDLNQVVKDVKSILIIPANIKIIVNSDLPKIKFEPTKITQIFQNLIGNSIKYMDKEDGFIIIKYKIKEEYIAISIKDNGPGIDERHFDKIFKMFQTLNRRDEIESTGVGLTIVKKIIDIYGGFIEVNSQITKGTEFILNIPKKYLVERR